MPYMTGVPNPHGKVAYSKLTRPEQLVYMREVNRKAYLKRVGGKLTRESPLTNTPEKNAQRQRNKSNVRCTRAKQARFYDELSDLVFKEAHSVRLLRNKITGFEWHVDHIIPLKGREVSGLHIWSNIQVIPKILNLKKGNKIAIHA
jgi:hypothetical protein